MKYPYIGKGIESGSIALIYGKDSAIVMDSKTWAAKNSEDTEVDESYFKNITAEYLANTYGEVKSKEHAEFIVRLCESAGIDVFPQLFDANHFVIKGKLSFHNCERITSSELKQITIPLPPECESADEWPKVGEIVLTASKSKAKVLAIHNKKAWVEYVSGANGFNTLNIASLSKPKTPEQELLDELHAHFEKYTFADQAINELPLKYNITKKGEGDE